MTALTASTVTYPYTISTWLAVDPSTRGLVSFHAATTLHRQHYHLLWYTCGRGCSHDGPVRLGLGNNSNAVLAADVHVSHSWNTLHNTHVNFLSANRVGIKSSLGLRSTTNCAGHGVFHRHLYRTLMGDGYGMYRSISLTSSDDCSRQNP